MGWWSDIRDSVFSPANGAAIGNALGQTWAYNYNQRGIDKALDAIKKQQEDLINQRAAQYRQAAEKTLNEQYGVNDYVGMTPQQGLLNAKKKWWQAQNDAQYLLNNGYDEKSDDVQKFRKEQAAAHEMAENFRKLGQAKNIDMASVGKDVNSLDAAKAAVSAEMSPYYQFGDYQLAKDALNIGYQKPPTKEEIEQAALKVKGLQFTPTQAELQNLYLNGNATPNDVAPPPDAKQVANEMAGAPPQQAPQAPQQQPPAQPNQPAGNTGNLGNQAPQQSPYSFTVDEVRKAANDLKNNPNTITTQDIYNTFGIDYDKLVGDQARQAAQADLANEKKSPDYRENLRRSLIKSGLPAGQVEAALQKIDKQEAEQQKKMAQAAMVASLKDNPQAAALINYALMNGADVKDIVNAFDKSGPNYAMQEVDTGGQKYLIRYDKNGRGAGSMQPFNVTASPNKIVDANVTMRGQNLNYEGKKMDNATKIKVADLNGRYGVAKAHIGEENKSSTTTAAQENKKAKYDQYIQQLLNGDIDYKTFKTNVIGIPGHDNQDSKWEDTELKLLYNFLREYNDNPNGANTKQYWQSIRPGTGNDELLARIDPNIIDDMVDKYGND